MNHKSSQHLVDIVQCVIPQKQHLWNSLYSKRVQQELTVRREVRWETEPTYKAFMTWHQSL